eukprot:gnl/MRDRNA2_/MRDRNA2_89531_c0_seq1.p1 gnl/MRDRNA2_/MRDRNA2_89531_c0~~gnl/MRDRNA2_/MRDRNA2_89531_c0_seq1.p1  ORF type:complete len:302 (+),score=85.35 gnl/MRDRNA2_/MRDRNA2_89531_c0_seq1:71-976(+)
MKSSPTLKPGQANGYLANTKDGNQILSGDKTRKRGAGTIPTVWDEQKSVTEQTQKLNSLSAGVERMSSVFEEANRAREEQRRMMDLLHERTMEQIGDARKYMEEMMAEMSKKMEDFVSRFENELDSTKEDLMTALKVKVAAMTAHIQNLEERARKMQAGLDKEKADRIRETEEVLGPIRKQVAKLISSLEKEQRIRRRREEEMMKALDDAVENLNNTVDIEKANREQKQKDMLDDNASELKHLVNRQRKIELSTGDKTEELRSDLQNEARYRVDAQNNVVENVTSFIQRFQENIKEEGQMG